MKFKKNWSFHSNSYGNVTIVFTYLGLEYVPDYLDKRDEEDPTPDKHAYRNLTDLSSYWSSSL